jgi:hypothetical protein
MQAGGNLIVVLRALKDDSRHRLQKRVDAERMSGMEDDSGL